MGAIEGGTWYAVSNQGWGVPMKLERQFDEDVIAQDAFTVRMQRQCRQVEQYRQSVLQNEGRYLSKDEAAAEWIEQFAEGFARDNDHP